MMMEHEYEPEPGLPAPLPEGETVLWQGAPSWEVFARRALRLRWVAAYFALMIGWGVADRLSSGESLRLVSVAAAEWTLLALAATGLLALYAWGVARTTLYTITNRRVVMRIGVALPMTLQIPFSRIDAAGVKPEAGEIAMTLRPGEKIAYAVLWPHARPWKLAKAQPALRGLADAAGAAQILSRALTASAAQPAAVRVQVTATGAASGGAMAAAHTPATA